MSYWLETCGDDLTPRRALAGAVTTDVAILGGGFSGLWTAYYLLRDNPGIDVAVVEGNVCGFGASGRNGGWCSSRFPVDLDVLSRRVGAERARAMVYALGDAIVEIERVVSEENIDAQFRRTGILSLARGKSQLSSIQSTYRSYEQLGLSEQVQLLDATAASARVHATKVEGALHIPMSATVHPGRLVRGLARAVERRGGAIYEGSKVLRCDLGERPSLVTARGRITARRAIVAAGEAYLSELPQFRRALLPMTSSIVLTAPLSEARWREIGWEGGESLASQSKTKNYLTRTVDGRILYGSRGVPYRYGSRMAHSNLDDEAVFDIMRRKLREWFPVLEGASVTHRWGGYLAIPRDWMPSVAFDPTTKFGQLCGYSGRGVSTTNLAARLIAGLITGRASGLESLPLHGPFAARWEPEPLRWIGVRYLQNALARDDAAEEKGLPAPWDAGLAAHLGGI